MLILKTQRKGPDVPFVSLLNGSGTRSQWIAKKTYSVKPEPNPIFFSSLNCSSSSFLKDFLSSLVGMLHNVHNFDSPMQKTHRIIYFQLGDVAQYLIL